MAGGPSRVQAVLLLLAGAMGYAAVSSLLGHSDLARSYDASAWLHGEHDFTRLKEMHGSAAAGNPSGGGRRGGAGVPGDVAGDPVQRERQEQGQVQGSGEARPNLAEGNEQLARFEAAVAAVRAGADAERAQGINMYEKAVQKPDAEQSGARGGEARGSSSGADAEALPCHAEEGTEYGGDVVKWGEHHVTSSPEECCDACRSFDADAAGTKPCNVWVYCPVEDGCAGSVKGACWLKNVPDPANPPVMSADSVWTSGALHAGPSRGPEADANAPGAKRKFHVLVTANQAVYVQWQTRVMYYHYKKQRAAQGPDGAMGGFTRILHSGRPDELMDEIPTVVVENLSNKGGDHGFVVLSRPYAFVQWAEKLARGEISIEEDYVLMAEPDHLLLRPLPNLMQGERAAAFPFFYIEPTKYPDLVQRFTGPLEKDQLASMAKIGSSPVQLRADDLARIAPVWMNVSIALKNDPEADKAWGWVLEMYGYTMAATMVGVPHDTVPHFQAQPPWDKHLGKFYQIHYTYGMDYTMEGEFTPGKIGEWRFDKRSYANEYPPKNLALPPKGVPELVVMLVKAVNEASANIPGWPESSTSTSLRAL